MRAAEAFNSNNSKKPALVVNNDAPSVVELLRLRVSFNINLMGMLNK